MNPVKVTTENGIMTATLADVENRNALGMALLAGLSDALDAAEADETSARSSSPTRVPPSAPAPI